MQGVNDALSRCVLMTNPSSHTYIRYDARMHACIACMHMQDDELSMLSYRAQVLNLELRMPPCRKAQRLTASKQASKQYRKQISCWVDYDKRRR